MPLTDRQYNAPDGYSDRYPWRIATVCYLNARPLIYGLDADHRVELISGVPSSLARFLDDDLCHAALVPVVDYQRSTEQWCIIPAGCIGSYGVTYTVRLFSCGPPEQVTTLWCDTDSHTSVILAGIILRKVYGSHPVLASLDAGIPPTLEPGQAALLIGDKVVSSAVHNATVQVDLGQQWRELTGLPFVFAVWMARPDRDLGDLPDILTRARVAGQQACGRIASAYAEVHGFSQALAYTYLTENIAYDFGPDQLRGMQEFYRLADQLHLLTHMRDMLTCDMSGTDATLPSSTVGNDPSASSS